MKSCFAFASPINDVVAPKPRTMNSFDCCYPNVDNTFDDVMAKQTCNWIETRCLLLAKHAGETTFRRNWNSFRESKIGNSFYSVRRSWSWCGRTVIESSQQSGQARLMGQTYYNFTESCQWSEETRSRFIEKTSVNEFNEIFCFSFSAGIAGLFTVFSSFIFTSSIMNFLESDISDLK